MVEQVIRGEEERFDAVLDAGLPKLEELLDRASRSSSQTLPGDEVFRLYDSLGVPLDFIDDLASERHLSIDRAGYDRAMEAQRERARAGSSFEARKAAAFSYASDAERTRVEATDDRFEGYATTSVEGAAIVAVFAGDRVQVGELSQGADGFVVTDRSPFYLEAGGQVSDTGTLRGDAGEATVSGVARVSPGGPRAHRVVVTRGALVPGQTVSLEVEVARRDAIRRNHTATHLVHAALRDVLGPHVKQAGSLVAPDRLRFDFVQPAPIGAEDLRRVERLVNEHVLANTPVQTEVRPTAEAIAAGAMALFGEKYGDTVRVVTVPGFSVELCGGTHCRATGDIGLFAITSEGGVAAGVRRVEAVTGIGAYDHYRRTQAAIDRVQRTLGVGAEQTPEAIERLQADLKRLTRELQEAKVQAAMGGGPTSDDTFAIDGTTLIARRVTGLDRAALRTLADSLKEQVRSGVIVLASDADGKVSLVVSVSKDLTSRVQAGQIVRQIAPIVGGGGGGRPDFAEAGGKESGENCRPVEGKPIGGRADARDRRWVVRARR